MIGTAVAPGIGTAIGGGIGAVGGALAGLFGASADDEDMRNDPEYQAAQRRERTMKMMSVALGHAFSAARPKTAQGALEPARMGV
ncbi:MAG: hypothetical protein ABIY63_13345 [Fibrobacteria bacterium]